MKKYVYILILIFTGCKSNQKVIHSLSCPSDVDIQYNAEKNGDFALQADKSLKAFSVYFLYEFHGQIKGYINDKLVYDERLNLSGETEVPKAFFGYNYSKDNKLPKLKIVSETYNTCFDIKIEKKYKIIYVYLSKEGKWTVRYSNVYYP